MKYYLGVVIAACTFLLGNMTGLLVALIVMMCIDMFSGLVAAGINGELSSRVGLKGIARKIMILSIVVVANMFDQYAGLGSSLRDMTILFYMANELISITENCGKMGVQLPDAITKALASLNKEG